MHWYDQEGNQRFTYKNKAGDECVTTRREARKFKLVPGCTDVIGVIDAPALTQWKITQMGEAMIDVMVDQLATQDVCNDRKALIAKARALSGKVLQGTADEGTRIHNTIENHINPTDDDYDPIGINRYIPTARRALVEVFGKQEWNTETPFAHELGFGGTADLWCSYDDKYIVVDVKTKDWEDPIKKPKSYDSHKMQLYACAYGLGIPTATRANLFLSRIDPTLSHVVVMEPSYHWDMFRDALSIWKHVNRYDGGFKR